MSITDDIRSQPSFSRAIQSAVAGVRAIRSTYDWVGVYLLEGGMLTLREDHFLGAPSIHTRIPLDSGICGAAASSGETIVVADVRQDHRYLACSLATRSEIAVPISVDGQLIGVLDLDSDTPAAFGDDDRQLLESVAAALARAWRQFQSARAVSL